MVNIICKIFGHGKMKRISNLSKYSTLLKCKRCGLLFAYNIDSDLIIPYNLSIQMFFEGME